VDDSHVYARLARKFVALVFGARARRDDRTPRLVTPVDHWCRRQVGSMRRRRTPDDDERQCDEKQQIFFELSQRIHCYYWVFFLVEVWIVYVF